MDRKTVTPLGAGIGDSPAVQPSAPPLFSNQVIPISTTGTTGVNNTANAAAGGGDGTSTGTATGRERTLSEYQRSNPALFRPLKKNPLEEFILQSSTESPEHVTGKMWFGAQDLDRTPYNPDDYAHERQVKGLKALKVGAYKLGHNGGDEDDEQLQEFVSSVERNSVKDPKAEGKKEGDGKGEKKEGETEKKEEENFEDYKISEGLSNAEAAEVLARVGPNLLEEHKVHPVIVYLKLLIEPMPLMIWIAVLVEGAIQNWIDFAILIGIQFTNATLSFYESTKAGNAVAALKKSLRPTAVCKREGVWDHHFDATQLVPGDLIQLEAGNAVPADCIVNDGIVECDESSLTGESLPVTLHKREMAKMGSSIARGECEATIVFTGKDTFFGRTAGLLNASAGERGGLQMLLIRIMVILVVMSVSLCSIAFAYLITRPHESLTDALSFTVVLIVASIPVAIEIVVTTTLALGSREMSAYGAIVSRLAAIEDMAGMDMLCSDKTGTLTKNKMMIQEETPLYDPELCPSQMELLRYACMAARWEQPPKDALDTLVLRCPLWVDGTVTGLKKKIDEHSEANPKMSFTDLEEWSHGIVFEKLTEAMKGFERLDYTPFDPKVKRTEAVVKFPDGKICKVTKGAPHVIGHLDKDPMGLKTPQLNKDVEGFAKDGIRAIGIAVSQPLVGYVPPDPNVPKDPSKEPPTTWKLLGLLTFLDPPRDDTKATIHKSEEYGVPVRMVTGDQILIAKKTCRDLEMGRVDREGWPHILGPSKLPLLEKGKPPKNLVRKYGKMVEHADGFAQVFPEHKYLIVETFRKLGYKTGMTGDGVNDAPALSRADVGIAVAGATDAARAAADIILTKEGLGTIVDAMQTSRKVFQRMKTFLTYRIGATLQLLVFFFIAVLSFEPKNYVEHLPEAQKLAADSKSWPTHFGMPVLMLMIITLLNDGTLISVGYDNTFPSLNPEKWNMKALFFIATFLGGLSFLSSLLLLHLLLDSNRQGSFFHHIGLRGLRYGQVICAVYLKVSISDFLTLFAARAQQRFFFSITPHKVLAIAGGVSVTITTLLALLWPNEHLDGIAVLGLARRRPYGLTFYIWWYCLMVFLLQDFGKVIIFKWMYKNNIFNILGKTEHKLAEDDKKDLPAVPFTATGKMAKFIGEMQAS